jgi:hypothetical protein
MYNALEDVPSRLPQYVNRITRCEANARVGLTKGWMNEGEFSMLCELF